MPELGERKLGTCRETAPVSYEIQKTGSFLMGEFFAGGNYRSCLRTASVSARDKSIARWATRMHAEDYHELNTYVFLALWAAQEAGVENILGAMLTSSSRAAEVASSKFKSNRYSMGDWPWDGVTAIEVAQKLDQKAKELTENGGTDISRRIQTLFSWFDVEIGLEEGAVKSYNEASMVRNVMLHRYSRLSQRDVDSFPHLEEWKNEVLPITTVRLNAYYSSVIAIHLAIAKAIWAAGYK